MNHDWINQTIYTYRSNNTNLAKFDAAAADGGGEVNDIGAIQSHILDGDNAFFKEKYNEALDHYLIAWTLILKFFNEDISIAKFVEIIDSGDFDPPNFFPALLEVAVEYRRLHLPVEPLSTWIKPKKYVLNNNDSEKLQNISKLNKNPSTKIANAIIAASAYEKVSEIDLADEILSQASTIAERSEDKASLYVERSLLAHKKGDNNKFATLLSSARRIYSKEVNLNGLEEVKKYEGIISSTVFNEDVISRNVANSNIIMGSREGSTLNSNVIADLNREHRELRRDHQKKHVVELNDQRISIDINDPGESVEILLNNVYALRKIDNDIKVYKVNLFEPMSVAIWLPVYFYLLIPMSIGDTYYRLGIYNKAVSFYLIAKQNFVINEKIEVPVLWLKLAKTYYEWGCLLYRNNNRSSALTYFEKIIKNGQPPSTSELYQGIFSSMLEVVKKIIDNRDTILDTRYFKEYNINPQIAVSFLLKLQKLNNATKGPIWIFYAICSKQIASLFHCSWRKQINMIKENPQPSNIIIPCNL